MKGVTHHFKSSFVPTEGETVVQTGPTAHGADGKSRAETMPPPAMGLEKDFKVCLSILGACTGICLIGILVIHFGVLVQTCNGKTQMQLPGFVCFSNSSKLNGTTPAPPTEMEDAGGDSDNNQPNDGDESGGDEAIAKPIEQAPAAESVKQGRLLQEKKPQPPTNGGVAYDGGADPFKDVYEDDKGDIDDLIFAADQTS